MKKIELLAPAGNMEKLEMVFHYGADAAYIGGKSFNLRALSGNFDDEDLKKAVDYAHVQGKKVYITLNIIPHNSEIDIMADYIKYLSSINVDGVIVADLGVFELVKENSNLNISISTQASNTNWRSVAFWKRLGAKRVVLAREVSLNDIKTIREKVPDVELEMFIHGAMCISISGRCLMSNYMASRDANRGACAHPCRWNYSLMEEKRPGEYFPVFEDDRGTYIFNSKDLCSIEFIDQILDIGIDSLKIEGRMKGIYYGANVVKVYRNAIDSYTNGNYKFDPNWIEELKGTSNRSFTSGFYLGLPNENSQNYNTNSSYSQTHQLVAKVIEKLEDNTYILEVRNRLTTGEELEVITQTYAPYQFIMPEMINNENDELIKIAHPNTIIKIKTDNNLKVYDMIRKKL
ncbi:MAG: U32 family peptidase [Fusobacteria bacterium]|nr:U32 family peptidase [Fusobacteriota bacterium]